VGTGWAVLWEQEVLKMSGLDDYLHGSLNTDLLARHNATQYATIISSHCVMRNIQMFDTLEPLQMLPNACGRHFCNLYHPNYESEILINLFENSFIPTPPYVMDIKGLRAYAIGLIFG